MLLLSQGSTLPMDTPSQDATRPNEGPWPSEIGDKVVEIAPGTAIVGSTTERYVRICAWVPTGESRCRPYGDGGQFCYPVYELQCKDVPQEVIDAIRGIIGILT